MIQTFFQVANFLFWLFILLNKLSNCLEYNPKLFVVFLLHRLYFAFEVFLRGDHLSETGKGSRDSYICSNGTIAVENGREHSDVLIGEGERRIFRMLASF